MRFLFAFLCLIALPLAAQAGPWPRPQGTWFIASTFGQERVAAGWERYGDFYTEYGLTDRLTLASQLRHTPRGWRGDLLARWHPGASARAPPSGLAAGLRLQPQSADRALLLFGAHAGHGFATRLGNAWTRLDVQLQARPAQPTSLVELSFSGQLGFQSAGGLLGMVSVTGKRRGGASIFELTPAIGHDIGHGRTLVLGLTASPSMPQVRSAQLSLWSRF